MSLVFAILLMFGANALLAQTSQGSIESEAIKAKTEEQKKETIKAILSAQTKAWNDGDLEKFMATYWKSERLSFSSGGKTTYGWQGTLDNYKKGYAPPKEMGQLHFDGLQVLLLESRSALVIGNWHLKFKDDSKRDGNFSLVVKKMDSGWKIIHDHSSELKKKDDEAKVETNKDMSKE